MSVLVSQILEDAAKVHLGDDQQEVYDNTLMLTYFPSAYRETYRKLQGNQVELARRITTVRLRATIDDYIELNSIVGYGEDVIAIYERPEQSVWAVLGGTISGGIVNYQTSTAHTLVLGTEVAVMGSWSPVYLSTLGLVIEIPDNTHAKIGFPVNASSPIGLGGSNYISYSSAEWIEIRPVDSHPKRTRGLFRSQLINNLIKVNPVPYHRQILIEHWLQPDTTTFAIGDSWPMDTVRDYLAITLALLAGGTKISESRIVGLENKRNEIGADIRRNAILSKQRNTIRRQPHWSTQVRMRNY